MNDIFSHNMPEDAAEAQLLKMESIYLHRAGVKPSRQELKEIIEEALKVRARKIVTDYVNADLREGPNAYQVLLRAKKTSEDKPTVGRPPKQKNDTPKEVAEAAQA